VISGVGKTKLIAISPYDITLVVSSRTPNMNVSVEAAIELSPLGLVDTTNMPAVVSVWILMNPSELDDAKGREIGDDKDLETLNETEVDELCADKKLEKLDEVRLMLDELEDLDIDDDELLNRLLEEVVEFHGGARVVKTVDGPGLGGTVVDPLGELADRTEVSVKVLVDT
jgi:hypothetical protein